LNIGFVEKVNIGFGVGAVGVGAGTGSVDVFGDSDVDFDITDFKPDATSETKFNISLTRKSPNLLFVLVLVFAFEL